MPQFCHLHCHTQYSLLDGAADIDIMMQKAVNNGQKAVAITDHGNMFGVFKFWASAKKHNIKPILGCEVYVVDDPTRKNFSKQDRDKRYHQLLLAKNAKGYQNLCKIVSQGFTIGYYSNFPRVSIEMIEKYSEGLVATTCCLGSQVQQTILNEGEEAGEKVFLKWLKIFGDDYYIELQRHNIVNIDKTGMSQEDINQVLIKWSKKHNVKMIATNDSHYVEQEDWDAHDALLCINSGSLKGIPIADSLKFRNTVMYKGEKVKERFGFKAGGQFYFKTTEEMARLFKDVPESLETTVEIADKVEILNLKRDILMPNYTISPEFATQDDYLKHLCFEGARKRYGELSATVVERLEHELKIIKNMGFPGYFLIVQDFIKAAKDIDVAVGPGRGSAAGSVVAYCTEITNIDPIKYNLLFERFLNPERVSMPDIDIDFDDEGRQKVIDYVVDKYGKKQVAQIITYGTMAAKSSIKDVARVLELPLAEANRISKMVPEGPKVTLKKAFKEVEDLQSYRMQEDTVYGKTLKMAEVLEGSVRHRGIHAAGVIIAPDDLTDYIPVCTSKDADLWVTQFDGKVIEDAGMLKMDFLGLKTLTIIKDAIINIHHRLSNKQIENLTPNIINPATKRIDPDLIAEQLEDPKTYQLFQRGETVGVFQFESPGMQKYMKQLKPTNIEDLIAMNALYRPGPMDYIPSFIDRKHGKEKVDYPHEWLEPILKPSYGIMVYQEQIMQTAQIVAGYSLGQADLLRRAMGKKKLEEMQRQRVIFRKGAMEKGVDEKKADEIFDIMEKFAAYGFNRSHSAAYSVVAFQTAYLKANYPAEYMAAVLTHNMNDIKKVTFFLAECNRMNLVTKLPDINESKLKFTVNKKGEIRYALAAIKGVGEAAVESIISERKAKGIFKDFFDVVMRVNLRTVNKKSFENLVLAGAFDSFKLKRSQYFYKNTGEKDPTLLETGIRFGNAHQKNLSNAGSSLFGASVSNNVNMPKIEDCEEWPLIERLNKERETIGVYLSGHPLDNYKAEMDNFCTTSFDNLDSCKDKDVSVGGIVMDAMHKTGKNGKPFGRFTIEDYSGSFEMTLFGEDYVNFRNYFDAGQFVFIKGRYQGNWRGDRYELKVQQVRLLSSLMEENAKSVTVTVALQQIDDTMIDTLRRLCKQHPGQMALKMQIVDMEDKSEVQLSSAMYRLAPTKKVFDTLEEIEGLKYKLN